MLYYDRKTARTYLPDQVTAKTRMKEIEDRVWLGIVNRANRENLEIVTGDDGLPCLKERTVKRYDKAELRALKAELKESDDLVLECYEDGLSMKENYPEVHARRAQIRKRIRELEEKTGGNGNG